MRWRSIVPRCVARIERASTVSHAPGELKPVDSSPLPTAITTVMMKTSSAQHHHQHTVDSDPSALFCSRFRS